MKSFGEFSQEQKPVLTERVSSVAYHGTDIPAAYSILTANEFQLQNYAPSSAELKMTNRAFGGGLPRTSSGKPKFFYMSVARTKTSRYLDSTQITVIFELDGDKLNQRYEAIPFNYWHANKRSEAQAEEEDRIFSEDDTIPNAMSYIKSIHIRIVDGMKTGSDSKIRNIIFVAKRNNIPVYVYDSQKNFIQLNKKVSSSVSSLMDKIPNERKSPVYKTLFVPDSDIKGLVDLIYAQDTDYSSQTDEGRAFYRKNLERAYSGTGAMAGYLSNVMSNYRRPSKFDVDNRRYVNAISRFMSANNMPDIESVIVYLQKKFPDTHTQYDEKQNPELTKQRMEYLKTIKYPQRNKNKMKSFKAFVAEGSAADYIQGVDDTDGYIDQNELQAVEKMVDALFKQVGIDVAFTKHFFERLNHERNKRPIKTSELMALFRKTYQKYGQELAQSEGLDGVLKDINTSINVPFVLNFDKRNNELDLVAKTIMRKSDFRADNRFYTVSSK